MQHTSQYGRGSTSLIAFRRKKFSAKRYQRLLLRTTDNRSHYRSVRSIGFAGTTNQLGLSAVASDVHVDFPLQYLGADFFTAAGGAITNDSTAALPIFSANSIVIRGGSIWVTIQNAEGTNDDATGFSEAGLKLKFWFGYTNGKPINIPAAFPSQQSDSWDPSCLGSLADDYGKIYYAVETIIQPGQIWEFRRKLRTHKLEYGTFKQGGNQPFIMFQLVSTKVTSPLTQGSYYYKSGYNLSFSGDATA